MKITAVATAFLAFLPASQASLRSKGVKSSSSKAQVIVHGVKHAFSDEDLAIINESAITAYNAVQKNSGYTLKGVKPLIHFGVNENELKQGCQLCPPDDDSFVADLKQGCQLCPPDDDALKQGCQLCPPDDDSFKGKSANALVMNVEIAGLKQGCQLCPPDDDAVALESATSHKDFADSFCALLAKSGSANLAGAHHCSFSFLEKPGHKVAPLQMVKRGDESALGFFSVKGLLHDLSANDIAIVEKVTLETYNEAFAKPGYSVESIRARGAVETPKSNKNLKQGCQLCPPDDDFLKQGCQLCPPDDDSFKNHGIANIVVLDAKVAGLKQGCQLCPPDDDAVEHQAADMEKINKAFSKALCAKLRNSGSPNLASADGCAMDFLYEHYLSS